MPDLILSALAGMAGGLFPAFVQYAFSRYAESERVRREIIETHLLQLQNSVESLYYRANNLSGWHGRSVMSDDYYLQSTAFALGQVLAHETLLVAKSVYARLPRNAALKREIKAKLHALGRALDDEKTFLHYHRMQLAEMLLEGDRALSYTEFLERWNEPKYGQVVSSVTGFIQAVELDRMKQVGEAAGRLVDLLVAQTGVPSALSLTPTPYGLGTDLKDSERRQVTSRR